MAVLVGRELKARYRGTVLGYFWSLLNPLLLLAVYSIVFTKVIPAHFESSAPYPLFLFAGLLPWLFASGAMLDSAIVLPDNGPLLRKVVCPPEVFPAVTVLSHLVHHLLALPILIVGVGAVTFATGRPFPWTMVLVPVPILLWTVAVGGLAMAISALSVHFRDIKDLLNNVLTLWFFVTPIIYPLDKVPAGVLRHIVAMNPTTPLIRLYRDLVLMGRVPEWTTWVGAAVVALVCWGFGALVFSRLRETLAETV